MLQPRSKPSRVICKIEVSAFAGVMFALLAALMGPHLMIDDHGIFRATVDLPHATHFEELEHANREDAMYVAVTRDGKVFFRETQVGPNDLPRLIKKQLREGAGRVVYIRADARAKYGTVERILDQIDLSGVQDVAFLTTERYVPSRRRP